MKSLLTLSLCLILCCAGCGSSGNSGGQKTDAQKIQTIMDRTTGLELPGMALYVQTPAYTLSTVSGVADEKAATPLTKQHLFRVASCSKTFLAVLTIKAHLDGKLGLDDKAATWLAHKPDILDRIANAKNATIRQLLTHTSGIPDVGRDVDFQKAVVANPKTLYTDEQVLRFMYGKPAVFAPGEKDRFHYSNTGYLLLGLVLDKVYNEHHAITLRKELLEPLGLGHTFYEVHDKTIPYPISHGYYYDANDVKQDTYAYKSEYGHAFGGLLSTADDLGRFMEAILTDDTFPNATQRREFMDLLLPKHPVGNNPLSRANYGLGLSSIDDDDAGGRRLIMHTGNINGYNTAMGYFPDDKITLVMIFNLSDPSNVRVSRQIYKVLFPDAK